MLRDHLFARFTLALLGGIASVGLALGQGIPPQGLPVSPDVTNPIVPAVAVETPGDKIELIQQLGSPVPPSIPDSPGAPKIPTGVTSTPPRAAPGVNDPPAPSVQLQIRTPAHIAGGKPIAYKLVVTNNSGATAYRVMLRVPMPEGAGKLPTKCEPAADLPASDKQLTWSFKSLAKGEQKVVELEFKPDVGAKEIRLRGHVSFEHGSEVITAIDKPKLVVKKTATPTAMQGELITVRVEVQNAGTVPIPQTRLVETIPAGVDFKNDKESEKGELAHQRIWQLGTLEPGQSKIVTYQLLGKLGGELIATSMAASDDKHASVQSETVQSKSKILVPALKIELTGPATVASKEAATYTARVQNTGTQPLNNVKVVIAHPDDCEATKVTVGARRTKDTVQWLIPKLAANEAFDLRLNLESATSGKKVVKATAKESRTAAEDAKEVNTTFLGRADLTWKPDFDDVTVNVGKQGMITVKVRNQGTETEKGVRLRVQLPSQVRFVQGTPSQYKETAGELVFEPRPVLPGKTESYLITYEAKQAGPADFQLLLEAECLNGKPLSKNQRVEINNAK